ncbi:MAG TPA: hypothetical protein VI248_02550 [Kineosporiaceae bacterium]
MPTLICDLDNVLFGDAPARRLDVWRAANGGTLGVATPAELADDALRAFCAGALPEQEYAGHLRARLGWTGTDEELVRLWSAGSVVVLEVLELLSWLRERDWQLIGAADADPWTRRARRDEFGWVLSVFERVVRGEEVGARRPDPRYFADLLRLLPRHGPRLYVDADARNVSAARRAGLDAHLFNAGPDGAQALKTACLSLLVAAG